MKEKPIMMCGDMVRATLREVDPKTQTRRVIKPQPNEAWTVQGPRVIEGFYADGDCKSDLRCPYGQPGDRLWVRETWAHETDFGTATGKALYRADGDNRETECGMPTDKWRPSIYMPRWASRITLEIVGVRVERVQDITEYDAMAEGIDAEHADGLGFVAIGPNGYRPFVTAFRELWDSINAKRGYGWSVNPFVWVVEFKRITPCH